MAERPSEMCAVQPTTLQPLPVPSLLKIPPKLLHRKTIKYQHYKQKIIHTAVSIASRTMPRATFYVHITDPAAFTCKLTRRACGQNERLLIWCGSEAEMRRLDKELWQDPPESFLPHEIWFEGHPYPQDAAAVLACGNRLPSLPEGTVVLNLTDDFWHTAQPLPQRVLEIVGNSPDELAGARERFRAYRDAGFTVEHHNMQGKAV